MFDALKLDAQAVAHHEEALRLRVRELPDAARRLYFERFKRDMKDPDTYAVLNWFFMAGFHHMYLERYARGMLNLVVMLIGIALLLTPLLPLGALLLIGILAIELMALFRAQTVVADYNNKISEQILADLD